MDESAKPDSEETSDVKKPESLFKETPFKNALQWVLGLFFLLAGTGVLFLDNKIEEEVKKNEPSKSFDTITVYRIRDTVIFSVVAEPPPIYDEPKITPPYQPPKTSPLNVSLPAKKEEPVPVRMDPVPVEPKYDLTGEYQNIFSKDLLSRYVVWKINQVGNSISAEVFKGSGKKKGDASGYVRGDTLFITSYFTPLAGSVAYLMIFDNGRTLDGEIMDDVTNTSFRIKLIRK